MIRGRCPTCSAGFEINSIDELPTFPFCSERCRLIDLGRWVDAKYVIPATKSAEPENEAAEQTVDEAEEYEE